MMSPASARLLYLGGDAALRTELRAVDGCTGAAQVEAFEACADRGGPLVVELMTRLAAPSSKAHSRARVARRRALTEGSFVERGSAAATRHARRDELPVRRLVATRFARSTRLSEEAVKSRLLPLTTRSAPTLASSAGVVDRSAAGAAIVQPHA
jgi:hypothetical protein